MVTDIIIVSYKDKPALDACVASIKEHCTDYNLIIEDNNPPNANRGFTKAVNDGILKGNAPWVWLLNSDALVLPGAQQALIQRMLDTPKAGLVGSMQIDQDNPDQIRFGGALRCFPAGVHKNGLISMGHCRFPEKQTWLNFASVLLRREMIQQVGLLDTHMYLLYSDSDYTFSCRYHGWEAWYCPESKVVHRLNASKGITEWHQKDMQAFMDKWNISPNPDGQTFYSGRLFQKLDAHP